MDPKIWGRSMWQSMIHIAQAYPQQPTEQQKNQYGLFYLNLANVLPCYSCQKNYQKHLNRLPIKLSNRDSLLKWIHQIHNLTLIDMNRSTINFTDFINKYTSQPSMLNKIAKIILFLSILAIAYYFLRGRYNSGNFVRR